MDLPSLDDEDIWINVPTTVKHVISSLYSIVEDQQNQLVQLQTRLHSNEAEIASLNTQLADYSDRLDDAEIDITQCTPVSATQDLTEIVLELKADKADKLDLAEAIGEETAQRREALAKQERQCISRVEQCTKQQEESTITPTNSSNITEEWVRSHVQSAFERLDKRVDELRSGFTKAAAVWAERDWVSASLRRKLDSTEMDDLVASIRSDLCDLEDATKRSAIELRTEIDTLLQQKADVSSVNTALADRDAAIEQLWERSSAESHQESHSAALEKRVSDLTIRVSAAEERIVTAVTTLDARVSEMEMPPYPRNKFKPPTDSDYSFSD